MAITYEENNSWRPRDGLYFPSTPPRSLDESETIADHLRRGDAAWDAYPSECEPYLRRAFEHWNVMWDALFSAAATEEMEFAAGVCVSKAWRIYLGRCVRWPDVNFDGSLPDDHPISAYFAKTRHDHRWWFTEDGWKQGLDWLAQGKFTS